MSLPPPPPPPPLFSSPSFPYYDSSAEEGSSSYESERGTPLSFAAQLAQARLKQTPQKVSSQKVSSDNITWQWKNPDQECFSGLHDILKDRGNVFTTHELCEADRLNNKKRMGIFGKIDKYFGEADREVYDQIMNVVQQKPTKWFDAFSINIMNHPRAKDLIQRKTFTEWKKPLNYDQRLKALNDQLASRTAIDPQTNRKLSLNDTQLNEIRAQIKELEGQVHQIDTVREVEDPNVRREIEQAYLLKLIGKKSPLEKCEEELMQLRELSDLDEKSEEYRQIVQSIAEKRVDAQREIQPQIQLPTDNAQTKTIVDDQSKIIGTLTDALAKAEAELLVLKGQEPAQSQDTVAMSLRDKITSYIAGILNKIPNVVGVYAP